MQVIEPNIKGIKKAVKKITNGEVVFIPTDTVYGIAANPFKEKAVKKIFLIKKRPISSSLILLCSNLKMAKKYAFFNRPKPSVTPLLQVGPWKIQLWNLTIFIWVGDLTYPFFLYFDFLVYALTTFL